MIEGYGAPNPRLYALIFPARVVTSVANDQPPPISGNNDTLQGWRADVTVAPTGSSLTADIKVFSRSSGSALRTLATVTITAGNLSADGTFAYDVLLATERIGLVVTQPGSGTPAEGLTVVVYSMVQTPGSIPVGPTGAAGTNGTNGVNGSWSLVQSQTLVGNATDITFSGLDGNTDEQYYLSCDLLVGSGGTSTVEIRPNNASTNESGHYIQTTGGAVSTGTTTVMFLGSIAGIGGLTAQVFLSAKTGKGRVGNVEWCRSDTAIGFSGRASILWNETATNITSLVIHSNAANGFGTGSKVSLYKLVR